MAERLATKKHKRRLCAFVAQKAAPATCWATSRGLSSTPSDEEGFHLRCLTDAKGSGRPDLFQRM